MTGDPLKILLDAEALKTPPFPPSSRYHYTPVTLSELKDGTRIAHLRRSFRPPPEQMATLTFHAVTDGERLDHITAKHVGHPTQFWQLCDANGAMKPSDLTTRTGMRVRIGLPPGVPGIDEE